MVPFPNGHFYSPVIDARELRARRGSIWPDRTAPPAGIELDLPGQRALLEKMRPLAADYDYGEDPARSRSGFGERNGLFEGLDARMLFCLLRNLRPRRLIEVGCGYSSLLSADVNRRYLESSMRMTCIDPDPPKLLERGLANEAELRRARVQAVDPDLFTELGEGDVLFIDSSHVSKTGSDVNFLYLSVLPRLARGVVIHAHDIFLPHDYPIDWVLGEERSWNEQYLLQALLVFSRGFDVLFGSACASTYFPERVESVFGKRVGGGSFWMRKTA